MAHIHANRVRDTASGSSPSGSGAVTVSGSPPTGYQTFSQRMTTNDTCFYVIQHRTANEWEVGIGTYSASNELTRTHVLASSNSDAAVSFSSGVKDVALVNIARNEFGARINKTASATLAITDFMQLIEMNVASANTLTIPPNSSVAFPLDTRIDVLQAGAGQTTLTPGSGVTINSKGGNLKLTGQWSACTLIKRATDTWVAFGDLSA